MMSALRRWLPARVPPAAAPLYWARGLRAFADGYVSLLLPVYLKALGFDAFQIGLIAATTLVGSAAATIAVGFTAHRFGRRWLLVIATLLMIGTGVGFVAATRFWPLMVVAFVGTLNPSPSDVSLFLPLEQALLAEAAPAKARTNAFVVYSLIGSLVGALGSLAAGVPELVHGWLGVDAIDALRWMFGLYAVLGLATYHLYRRLPASLDAKPEKPAPPLGPSRKIVFGLAALFSLDAFGGGLVVQSLLALWLFERFGLSLAVAGTIFFWSGLASAASFIAAGHLAKRIGLVNTMVFTHFPSNLCLIAMAFAPKLWLVVVLWLVRSALSQMDVPARTSYVMAMVTPPERAAAASVTAVPRSLAAAVAPALAGWLLALSPFGWPVLIAGGLKGIYDLLLLGCFGRRKPPEEAD
ncbi:MAG: MFS transporter [Alphaproteobacteria bacterium]|nr:MFS transporter [Alphaproteobacteria bacterium]